jgi:hypothetical protein
MRLFLLAGALLSVPVAGADKTFSVEAPVGVVKFTESETHTAAGIAVGLPLSRRWSFKPEFLYLHESEVHDDLVLLPNLNFDFVGPGHRVRPFVTVAPGVLWYREKYPHFRQTSTDFFLSGGVGAKVFLTDHVYVAPQVRTGVELHLGFTVAMGYEWGR